MHASAQAFGFPLQRVADKQPRKPWIAFDEAEHEKHDVAAARGGCGLFLEDHANPAEQGVFGKRDQRFEHLALAWKVTVQSRLGNPHPRCQARGGDAAAGLFLQHQRQRAENLLLAFALLPVQGCFRHRRESACRCRSR